MSYIQLTADELEELVDAAESAVGMMEPYYVQCGASEELIQIIEKFRAKLPYAESVVPPKTCPECGRTFKEVGPLNQHLQAKHEWSPKRRKTLLKQLEPYTRVWPSYTLFQQHLATGEEPQALAENPQ